MKMFEPRRSGPLYKEANQCNCHQIAYRYDLDWLDATDSFLLGKDYVKQLRLFSAAPKNRYLSLPTSFCAH